VNIGVSEKATGNILLGAGFSSAEGLILSGSINQANVFGSGNLVTAQMNTGAVNTVYSLSFNNPYFTLDGVSLGYDVYRRDVDSAELDDVGEYESSTIGLGMRFGLPLNEKDTIFVGGAVERLDLNTTGNSPIQYQKFVDEYGNTSDTLRLDASIARDTRDHFMYPSRGVLQRAAIEFGVPPGDIEYYKLTLQHQHFFPLSKDFTLMLNGEFGYGGGMDNNSLPFYRNFYAGGISSVRGFQSGTIGPKEKDPGNNNDVVSLGGDTKFVGNIELFFPMPGITDNSLRLSTFVDAGAIFGPGDSKYGSTEISFDEFRYSVGLGVQWNSPLGPLRFSLAYPFNEQVEDQTEIFQFSMGNTF
jgi:outer membrane protein insertion porin family